MHHAVIFIDPGGVVRYWNAAATELYGYDEAEAVGASLMSLIVPPTGRRAAGLERGRVAKGKQYDGTWTVQDKDGHVFDVVVSATPVRDEAGEVIGVVGVSHHPAGEQEVERNLEQSERRWRARFEQSTLPQAILSMDAKFLEVNDALCRVLGVRRGEIIGTASADWHHPTDVDRGPLRRGDFGADGVESARWERIYRRADGAPVPLHIHATLIRDADGTAQQVACFAYDLTSLREAETSLRAVSDRYEALLTEAADWAILLDADMRIVYMSPSFPTIFECEASEVLGSPAADFIHLDDLDHVRAAMQRVLSAPGNRERVLMRLTTGSGRTIWVEDVFTNRLDDPVIQGIIVNGRDVTDRVDAESALRASETRFRTIAETAQDGIWFVDLVGNTRFANAKVAEILGVTLEQVYATRGPELLMPEEPTILQEKLRHRVERGTDTYEVTYRHPSGDDHTLRVVATPMREGDIVGSLSVITDITDLRRMEAELRRLAVHDELTGLPNRALLVDRLEQALSRAGRDPHNSVFVLFVDLDNFKLVNDSWGHAAGDELLRQVGQRLQVTARSGDTVGRFGGDEFVVVCEGLDQPGVTALARQILAAVSQETSIAGQLHYATASIGIAASPGTSEELLRWADAAMYDAKARGRGRLQFFDTALAERASDRLVLSRDLRTALQADELVLHYQPIVDLATGELVRVEALARWHHPERGSVPPTDFVPVAELTGLGPALDSWALRRGSREAALLRSELHLPTPVAVNVSAAHHTDPSLEPNLLQTLADLRLPRDVLELEITENALMEHPEQARETLQWLASRGIGAAIDDFGTGYSSLAYLKHLPVQVLKIDRSFIAALADDEDAYAIVAAVVDLARTLGLRTVAEGVETRQQLSLLQRLGCWAGQGYLWSAPLLPEELIDLVRQQPHGRFDVTVSAEEPSAPSRRRDEPTTAEHGLHQIMRMHREGSSLTTIAAALNADGFRTPQGLRWHRASVARVISGLAYSQLANRTRPT